MAWILAVLMTVQVAPVEVRAEEAEEARRRRFQGAFTEEVGRKGSRVLGEVTEKWMRRRSTFRMEDRSRRGEHGVPVHLRGRVEGH